MTTIKSNYLAIISDSTNQTFNVVYPIRPKNSAEFCREAEV